MANKEKLFTSPHSFHRYAVPLPPGGRHFRGDAGTPFCRLPLLLRVVESPTPTMGGYGIRPYGKRFSKAKAVIYLTNCASKRAIGARRRGQNRRSDPEGVFHTPRGEDRR